MPEPETSLPSWSDRWHKPVFIAFLLAWGLNTALLWLGIPSPAGASWLDGLCLLLALGTTLLGLGRRLPFQNVLMAAGLIALLSGAVLCLGAASGVPFGPVQFSERLGGRLLDLLPWPLPWLWVVVLINARGVARLIMRPWRRTGGYGFWVIGIAGLLAAAFDLTLEPFAVRVKGWWTWPAARTTWLWYSAPWVSFLGWFAVTVAILVFTTPWLINKQPGTRLMDYHPLVVWTLLGLGLVVGNATQGAWSAVWTTLAGQGLVAWLALRGGNWKRQPAPALGA